jgi:uncharacterized protein with NAD-binding domain and iron-sulfur cluster
MASLAAAWTIAKREPDSEITIFQLGWRLGGKGASSRNRCNEHRSEEHGLHVWFGCYDNAFRILRECYEAVNPRAPFATVEDAFHPQDRTPFGEFVDGVWRFWPLTHSSNCGVPGNPMKASLWDHFTNLLTFADQGFEDWRTKTTVQGISSSGRSFAGRLLGTPPELDWSDLPLHQCRLLAEAPHADPVRLNRRGIFWVVDRFQTWRYRRLILGRLRWFRSWSHRAVDPTYYNDEIRRIWTAIDLAVTVALGVLVDGVLLCGLESIDGEDLRAWLTRHGAHPTTVWSGITQALYDLVFAYEDGETGDGTRINPGKPNFAAGTALEVLRRILFTYSGSISYEPQAGMGEVVFVPIYKALKSRNVKFEFFQRVTRLELADNGKSVTKIHVGRQVKLKNETYDPLILVDGLECWPNEPNFEQLEDAKDVKGVDLEGHWNGWSDVEERVLEVGKHFDDIILGIPIAALTEICGDLIHRKRIWRRMSRHVKTVQTLSVQLWMKSDLQSLGWIRGPVPVDACPEPLDVWADMSHILPLESWSDPAGPRSIQYLCGPLCGNFQLRPRYDADVPAEALRLVRDTTISWLGKNSRYLWPNSTPNQVNRGFDWDLLYDPTGEQGERRLNFQYLRANVDPTARYTLSVAGSTRYRMRPDETGCKNLFVAGDWTYTPYNAGCMEAAAISGVDAAHALLARHDATLGSWTQLLYVLKQVARSLCRLLIGIAIFRRRIVHRHRLARRH